MLNFPLQRRRLDPLFAEVDLGRLFEDLFKSPLQFSLGEIQRSPALDIYEKEKNVIVKAEIPGLKPEEMKLSVDGDLLVISGDKKLEKEVTKDNCYLLEHSYGKFQRTVRLPGYVKAEGAKATYKNGILKVELPKDEDQRQKEIKIDLE
ncbi:MAG: Hsp20/alpha crystallin family protein [Candidatus Omnitrophota bacterium]